MKEDFLHYLWRFQKLGALPLQATSGAEVVVVSPGVMNSGGGPDFLNAKIWIDDTLWAGDVEIHLRASSWFEHQHHLDSNYDAVILHVVWEDDQALCYPSGRAVPCLVLGNSLDPEHWERYQKKFITLPHWIPCEKMIASFPEFKWSHWKERLYLQRLEEKTLQIRKLLKTNYNNWEQTLFELLAKNFGLNRNGDVFLQWAQRLPFAVVQKNCANGDLLEALFMGMAGLLNGEIHHPYPQKLRKDFDYLKRKYGFNEVSGISVNFGRLRPPNFPTIRLSQLAQLYHQHPRPFSLLIKAEAPRDLNWIRTIGVSEYWKTHYTFEKESAPSPKRLSQSFFDLLMINTLIPLRFAYAQIQEGSFGEELFRWIRSLPAEKNRITQGFSDLGLPFQSALDSQSLLQLKKDYCDKKKCLHCAVGFHLFDN